MNMFFELFMLIFLVVSYEYVFLIIYAYASGYEIVPFLQLGSSDNIFHVGFLHSTLNMPSYWLEQIRIGGKNLKIILLPLNADEIEMT